MKMILGFLLTWIPLSLAQAHTTSYVCSDIDGNQQDFRLRVTGPHGLIFTISSLDESNALSAVLDDVANHKNPRSSFKTLKTLDDVIFDSEGVETELRIHKTILRGAQEGYAQFITHIEDKSFTIIYKCSRTVKI